MSGISLAEAHRVGFDLVRRHTGRFVAYVRELAVHELDLPVPGLDWTVGETVTHVRSVYERYTVDSRRAERAADVARINAEDIARLGGDVAAAVQSIEDQVATLTGIVDHVAPERTFPFHGGTQITLAGGWGNLLGELHAHGDDLARATGRPFGIPGEDLEILWRHTLPALRGWLHPTAADLEEAWEVRLPFGVVAFSIDRGALRTDESREPDHVVAATDAAELTLQFPYRRRLISDPEVALLFSRFSDV